MKTEIKLTASVAGKILSVNCEEGQMVRENDVLVNIDVGEEASDEKPATIK